MTEGPVTDTRGRSRLLIAVVTLVVAVAVPLAFADAPGSETEEKAAGLAKKVRKLQKQVRKLQMQVAGLPQEGPRGPAGPQGETGAAGAPGATGPQGQAGSDAQFNGAAAGGDLTGTYPNPQIATAAVAAGEIATNGVESIDILDEDVRGVDVVEATLFNDNSLNSEDLGNNAVGIAELAANSVGASELGALVDRGDPTPTLIPGGTAENGSYNVDFSAVACSPGEELIGGHGLWVGGGADAELFIKGVVLDHGLEQVLVEGGNDSGVDANLAAVATCLQP